MYTLSSTLKEIFDNPFIFENMHVVGLDAYWFMVPKKKKELPLEELEKTIRMPWGGPFVGAVVIAMANLLEKLSQSQGMHFEPLWRERNQDEQLFMPAAGHEKDAAGLLVFDTEGEEMRKPILVCPGGAYMFVAVTEEGISTAEALLEKGYRPFVLKYRCTKANPHPTPQVELTLAIKYLRANAEKYHIDPEQLTIIGYSAGGHLCASQPAYAEEYDEIVKDILKEENPSLYEKVKDMNPQADYVCLSYAAIYLEDERDKEFRDTITGENDDLIDKLSIDRHVTEKYSKTYIWCCEDDRTVPYAHSERMAKALEEKQVPHKLHIYPAGDHGISVGTGTTAEGWVDEMLEYFYK